MTSRTIDVHCAKCNAYIYSLPLYPTDRDYALADKALCELHKPKKKKIAPTEPGLPPRGAKQSTHWETCWQDRDHHMCAIRRVERHEQEILDLKATIDVLKSDIDGRVSRALQAAERLRTSHPRGKR